MAKMTKKQFEEYFKDEVLPYVAEQYERDGVPDGPARSEAWNNTVDAYIQDGMLPQKAGDWTHPRWLDTYRPNPNTNPLGAEGKTALGAGVGALGGAIVGGMVAGLPGAVLGSAGGGAGGGHYTAPEDRKNRGAVGGGVGGIIFGPIGAAVGGYIGGGKPGKKGNPQEVRKLKAKLLR